MTAGRFAAALQGRRRWLSEPAPARDGVAALLVGLVVRAAVVGWAAGRFPPVEDGRFYHVVAGRVAQGYGYTWLWPDGAVTFAAHYPVGYPALVGGLYAVFGQHPVVAMVLNAALGSLAVLAVHRVAATVASRAGALLAALLIALHPTLVAYTPALMTEGVVAALLAVVAWPLIVASHCRSRARYAGLAAMALLLGVTTLIRPQSLLYAPLFGWLAARSPSSAATAERAAWGWRGPLVGAAVTTALVVATCLPWTLRNCSKLERCVFVSANAGWNLLIGAGPGATGAWVPIEVAGLPPECRTVFGEAQKDACFAGAALREIRARPLRWLGLGPAKLASTFDGSGTPGYYLHASNPQALSRRGSWTLASWETVWQRLVVGLGLLALALHLPARRTGRLAWLALSGPWLLLPAVWVSYLGLAGGALLLGRGLLRHPPACLAAASVALTALTHVVFFGAGRYSLVCYPLLAALAGCVLRLGLGESSSILTGRAGPGDTGRARRVDNAAD